MAITYTKTVVKGAFETAIGTRVPDPNQTIRLCVDEFSGAYKSLGVPGAFAAAIKLHTPIDDDAVVNQLVVRFETALADAKDEADRKAAEDRALAVQKLTHELAAQERADERTDKRAAQDRADRERAEDKAEAAAEKRTTRQENEELDRDLQGLLRRVDSFRRDAQSFYDDIDTDVRRAIRLSRAAADAQQVQDAVKIAEDVLQQADKLITRVNDSARNAREGVRDRIKSSIDAEIDNAEEISNSLRSLRRLAADSIDVMQEAVNAANEEKELKEKEAAIKKAVDDSASNITVIEGIVAKVEEGVDSYSDTIRSNTGADPTDNPDALNTAAGDALTRARAANQSVIRASELADKDIAKTDAEAAALLVAAEVPLAQAPLDDINGRNRNLTRTKSREVSIGGHTKIKEEKEEKEREARLSNFLSSTRGQLIAWGGLALLIFLTLIFLPWWVQVPLIIGAALTAGGLCYQFLRGKGKMKAENITGGILGYIVVAVTLIGLLFLSTAIGKGPGSDWSPFGGGDPEPTATAAAAVEPTPTVPSFVVNPTKVPEGEDKD